MTHATRTQAARAIALALLACAAGVGCMPGGESRRDSTDVAASSPEPVGFTPPDSATIRTAVDALDAFLRASREGSPTHSALARLTACPTGDSPAAGPMLGGYELLPATTRADTVVGRAVVTTVAEQDMDRQHPGWFVARLRVRSDTLEWDLLRAESGDWVVCNGLRFGLTAPDSLTSWRPAGASAASARALADSLAARR
jgi:hypothetical protein